MSFDISLGVVLGFIFKFFIWMVGCAFIDWLILGDGVRSTIQVWTARVMMGVWTFVLITSIHFNMFL